eukprot:1161623-Pelagomonas_calceolata.AAC.9
MQGSCMRNAVLLRVCMHVFISLWFTCDKTGVQRPTGRPQEGCAACEQFTFDSQEPAQASTYYQGPMGDQCPGTSCSSMQANQEEGEEDKGKIKTSPFERAKDPSQINALMETHVHPPADQQGRGA